MDIIILALSPVFIIAFYVYYRDKYEKEPITLLIKSLVMGMIITIPVVLAESYLSRFSLYFNQYQPAYDAFIVASFTEESFKYIALILLIWKNPNFNEKFDGLVYGVFVSLGFAGIENFIYVNNYGLTTGWMRAFSAVPSHAIDGIVMGYYFSLARFSTNNRGKYLVLSLVVPVLLHGFYDLLLMSGNSYMLLLFIPFLIYLYYTGFRRMKMITVEPVNTSVPDKDMFSA